MKASSIARSSRSTKRPSSRKPISSMSISVVSRPAWLAVSSQIGQRAGILGILGHAGEMKVMRAAEFLPGLDQALMDRIELVGALRE